MDVLKKHLEKVVLGVVVLACAVFAYLTLQSSEADISGMKDLEANRRAISEELDKKRVTDKYKYGLTAAEKVKYREALIATFERGKTKVEEGIPAYVAYPILPRPYVDPTTAPRKESDLIRDEFAEVLPLGEVKAEGDHGRVFVTFRLPNKMKYMEAVRIEVFRGQDEKKIDPSKPYGTLELGPEQGTEAAAAPAATEAGTAAPEKAAEESGAARRRRERAEAETKEGPKAAGKKPAEEIPAEYADLKVFSDTRVEPKKTYYYQARLVARMSVPEGKRFEIKDAAGRVTRIIVAHAPRNAQTIPGASSNVVLYPTALSGVVSAIVPDNFQIRLSGYSGKIDPLGTPDFKKTKDYKGRFAIRVWVTEAQAWKEQTLDIAPDERLKGTLAYKPAGSDEPKTYDFDSGYKLVEIKMVATVREMEVEETEIGPDGNPVMDEKTKQPKRIKKIKNSDPIINEVAVLENIQDGKLEEFPKRADFERRKAELEYISRLAGRQAEQQKASQKPAPKK